MVTSNFATKRLAETYAHQGKPNGWFEEFYAKDVAQTFRPETKRTILRDFLQFFEDRKNPELLKVMALKLVVIPLLNATFTKSQATDPSPERQELAQTREDVRKVLDQRTLSAVVSKLLANQPPHPYARVKTHILLSNERTHRHTLEHTSLSLSCGVCTCGVCACGVCACRVCMYRMRATCNICWMCVYACTCAGCACVCMPGIPSSCASSSYSCPPCCWSSCTRSSSPT